MNILDTIDRAASTWLARRTDDAVKAMQANGDGLELKKASSEFTEGRQYQRQADAYRIAQLEAENAALKAQVVALKADNDVFSRYVRDNMALVAHDDRCVVCERGGHCSEREALEKDDWKSFGEVMQIYQRRSAQTSEVKA